MKQKIYSQEQLEFFPLYTCTTDINYPQEKVIRPNGFVFHQIFIVSDGNGFIKANGISRVIGKDDMFYITAHTPHEYYGIDGDFRTSYISFCGYGFEKIKKYYNLGDFGIYRNKNKNIFKSSLDNLFENFETAKELSSLCAMTFSVVIDFFDEVCKKEYSPIESVCNFIESNYSKKLTLEDIMKFYPYSKSKLCCDFKQKYNMTVFDMIIKTRLKNARHMIKNNSEIKLDYIARSCGFNDTSYFCKAYKKFYGTSPKQRK